LSKPSSFITTTGAKPAVKYGNGDSKANGFKLGMLSSLTSATLHQGWILLTSIVAFEFN
jgi:hypothetical protein